MGFALLLCGLSFSIESCVAFLVSLLVGILHEMCLCSKSGIFSWILVLFHLFISSILCLSSYVVVLDSRFFEKLHCILDYNWASSRDLPLIYSNIPLIIFVLLTVKRLHFEVNKSDILWYFIDQHLHLIMVQLYVYRDLLMPLEKRDNFLWYCLFKIFCEPISGVLLG